MRRVIVALSLHDYDELGDVALDLERIFVDSDPTVWASSEDFVKDALDPLYRPAASTGGPS